MRDGGRLKKKEGETERERRGSETDVPKLYPTMNVNSLCNVDKTYKSRFVKSFNFQGTIIS